MRWGAACLCVDASPRRLPPILLHMRHPFVPFVSPQPAEQEQQHGAAGAPPLCHLHGAPSCCPGLNRSVTFLLPRAEPFDQLARFLLWPARCTPCPAFVCVGSRNGRPCMPLPNSSVNNDLGSHPCCPCPGVRRPAGAAHHVWPAAAGPAPRGAPGALVSRWLLCMLVGGAPIGGLVPGGGPCRCPWHARLAMCPPAALRTPHAPLGAAPSPLRRRARPARARAAPP